jgi:hypothetical protein
MGNTIDWQAIPVVAELVGFDDIERLVEGLLTIRDVLNAQAAD